MNVVVKLVWAAGLLGTNDLHPLRKLSKELTEQASHGVITDKSLQIFEHAEIKQVD